MAAAIVCLCYLLVTPFGLAALRAYRDDHVDQRNFGAGITERHPVWHNAYIGLGYLPNKWQIKYYDEVASRAVERVRPGTHFVSPTYERILRRLWFRALRSEPGFVLGQFAQKIVVVYRHAWLYLAALFLTVPWVLAIGARRRRFRAWLLLIAPALVIASVPPLITVPFRDYELGLFGALGLIGLLVTGELARPALALVGRAIRDPRSTLRAVLSDARRHLATSSGRWAVAVSGLGLLLLVASFLPAQHIQERATTWYNAPIVRGPLP